MVNKNFLYQYLNNTRKSINYFFTRQNYWVFQNRGATHISLCTAMRLRNSKFFECTITNGAIYIFKTSLFILCSNSTDSLI